jgi:hypothetical protein
VELWRAIGSWTGIHTFHGGCQRCQPPLTYRVDDRQFESREDSREGCNIFEKQPDSESWLGPSGSRTGNLGDGLTGLTIRHSALHITLRDEYACLHHGLHAPHFCYQAFRALIMGVTYSPTLDTRQAAPTRPLCPTSARDPPSSSSSQLASALMSLSHPTASISNNFQLIINDALNSYKKRTKKDLLSHPLATQLQTCNSPGDILAVLHQQVQGLDQSRSSDDRLIKWLDPAVNVLYTLSETLGEGVSLVSLRTNSSDN